MSFLYFMFVHVIRNESLRLADDHDNFTARINTCFAGVCIVFLESGEKFGRTEKLYVHEPEGREFCTQQRNCLSIAPSIVIVPSEHT